MKHQAAFNPFSASVTVVSIWSKIDPSEGGALMGRDKNFTYTVQVPAGLPLNEALEAAFHITNRDDRPFGRRCCSTSCGDVLILNGEHFLVEGRGFAKLTQEESEKIQQLTSRDTSFGLAFLRKNNMI